MLKIAYALSFCHPLPEGHRFPMLKYELIPQQLIYEGIITPENLFKPDPLDERIILLTHDAAYWEAVRSQKLSAKAMRKIGFPLSPELVQREMEICKGTLDCTFFAIEHGAAMNVAGGTHHAFADRGEGFCILNDFAISCNYLLANGHIRKALIIDLDVHQGNGTAALFSKNPNVYTFSMHGKDNYPLHKESSDWDIPLKTACGDDEYLTTLSIALSKLYDEAMPDFVFYLSGVDVLKGDKLGKLALSLDACKKRDELVVESCFQRGLPLVVAMGGGYSPELSTIVNAHCQSFQVVQDVYFS